MRFKCQNNNEQILYNKKIKLMNVVDLNQRVRQLQYENDRLKNNLTSNRNSESHRGNSIDFQTKYKKALKQIYEVIQANKQLKQQLDKLKTSRNKLEGSMADVRKEQIYKVYEVVLNEKNELKERTETLQAQRQRFEGQVQALEAEVNVLKGEKLFLAQQKQAAEAKALSSDTGSKAEELHQLQMRFREKEQEFHRTLQNYQQHHITLSNQNKKNEQRLSQMQQRLIQTDKNWRNRFQTKEIEFKEIRTHVRHEYQDQINSLRKELNSLKLLNTELMTRLQTIEMDGRNDEDMTEYEMQMLASVKELRLQLQPLRRQIIDLQQQNSFQRQQSQREHTQLQLKLYQHQSNIQHYTILLKNQEDKIQKMNEQIKKHNDNEAIVKKLEEDNRVLGGRVIVLESKELAVENRREGRRLEENVLEFQTRVEMLLDEKENLANVKNISIHQLMTLKAYIVEMDQKLKNAYTQNEYATKKYRSYKEKYLSSIKEIKTHQMLQNTLKSKIMGYDKLVQRLQSQLQKNVNISQMQQIDLTTKSTHQQVQIQTFRKKYQSLKQKLVLQQKYNRQQLQTVKLNYQTKIVDLSIKMEELNGLRQSVGLYKEKNEGLMEMLSRKEEEVLEARLAGGRYAAVRGESEVSVQVQNREVVASLQEVIHRQQASILKLQGELRTQEDATRKRILSLQRQLQDINSEYNKVKLSSTSTKNSSEKSTQQFLTQNKRLKNRISELENEIILLKGRTQEWNNSVSKNSYELEFRVSNLEIERNELANRLETEISYKKRLEKQCNQAIARTNELDAQLTQANMQNARKLQELRYQITEKQTTIETLQEQLKRLKAQQRSNLESSSHLRSSAVSQPKEDHSMCQTKIKRLQRQLQNIQADNESLRKKVNEGQYSSSSFSYELESLKHEKEEARLRVERLEKEVSGLKAALNANEEEKYEANRAMAQLKSQLSTARLSHQDDLFEKDRVITQLRSKLQHLESSTSTQLQTQSHLQQTLQQKERQVSSYRLRLSTAQTSIQQLNDTINKYTKQLNTMRYANESSHTEYTQHMQQLLEEKTRTLRKYEEQINSLRQELEERNQEVMVKQEALVRVQREVGDFREIGEEIDRLKAALVDRETLIARSRFEINEYEEDMDRARRENSTLKEQLQSTRMQLLHKDDQISSLRLEISTTSTRMANQIKSELLQQLSQRQSQLSRLTFQTQSLQNNYANIQQQLNDTEARERKAQQQLSFLKGQLSRTQQQLQQTTQRLMKRESQLSQINGQMTGLKYLQEQVNEKNATINKLRQQLTSIRIELSHLTEELQYKESTIIRQNNELKMVRQEGMDREDAMGRKDMEMRNLVMELQRVKATCEELEGSGQQKDSSVSRLTAELNRVKQEHRDLEEEMEEREQEWSNIQYQLTQANSRIALVSDQLESKDIAIAKLANESAFLKQEITRLNEELVEKNHEINRINQQVFVQKMEYTNRTSEEVQTLSNQLFGVKRQLENTRHTVEDLQGENRRLMIELEGSRIRFNEQSGVGSGYIYTQLDMSSLKDDNNKKYRQIMQLQFQLTQQTSQTQLLRQRTQQLLSQLSSKDQELQTLHQKTQKLQTLITQLEEENQYNSQHLQHQTQEFIETQRRLRYQIEEMQYAIANSQVVSGGSTAGISSNNGNGDNLNEHNNEELKFGLKLYTEETDRLKTIIDQLTEEVNGLRLKLTAFTNQEDRIQENLVTMVMTFAQVQALRERMKNKQQQINEVRRSFIAAISSSDANSQQGFKSSKLVNMANANVAHDQRIQTFEDVLSQNSASMINYKSEKGVKQGGQAVKEIGEYEVRSDKGALEHAFGEELAQKQQIETQSLQDEEQHYYNYDAHVTYDDNANTQHYDRYELQQQYQQQQQRQIYEQQYSNQQQQHEQHFDQQMAQNNETELQYQQQQEVVEQQNIDLPEPQGEDEGIERHETSHQLDELNQLREQYDGEEEIIATSQVNEVTFRHSQQAPLPQAPQPIISTAPVTISQPQSHIITSHHAQQQAQTQQRSRTINISYHGTTSQSQVQTTSSLDTRNVHHQQQRISSSQFQAPSGATYVRITSGQSQQGSLTQGGSINPPGVYVPQGMNIQPVRHSMPIGQPMPQQGNRIVMGGPMVVQGQHVVNASFPVGQNPQNLRY